MKALSGDGRPHFLVNIGLVVIALAVLGGVLALLAKDDRDRGSTTLPPQGGSAPVAPSASGTAAVFRRPAVLILGDSYSAGEGAKPRSAGWAPQVAGRMNWILNSDTGGPTSFISGSGDGRDKLFDRLPELKARYLVDIVIIDVGRDDLFTPVAEVKAASQQFLRSARRTWPEAPIVIIVPYTIAQSTERTNPAAAELSTWFDTLAGKLGNTYVLDPAKEQWIPQNRIPALLAEDRLNPNNAGHKVIADSVVNRLRMLGLDKIKVTDTRVNQRQAR